MSDSRQATKTRRLRLTRAIQDPGRVLDKGWFRDPNGQCQSSFNLTHGLSIVFTP